MTYRIYCWRHYPECKERPSMDKDTFMPMISYAAWGLYGDGCYSLRQQGTNILLNMFFGTVVNAANGIATSVLGIVSGFTQNILTAFRPQIIKSYAANDFKRMEQLLTYASKYSLLLIRASFASSISEPESNDFFTSLSALSLLYPLLIKS